MKPLEKIIVPTDLSEGSRRAIEYAAWLAAENQGQVLIMHVANEFAAWDFTTTYSAIRKPGRWIGCLPKRPSS